MVIIFGFLLIAGLATVLPRLTHAKGGSRLKSLKVIVFRTPFLDPNHLPRVHLRLVFLWFNVFLFLVLNILIGNIQTAKVAVSTDEIEIFSIPKLISTSKTLALGFKELNLIRMAPERSFLKKLSEKKFMIAQRYGELNQMRAKGIENYLVFMGKTSLAHLIALQSHYAHLIGSVAFISPIGYYESLVGFQMRRKLRNEIKRLINSR